MVRDVARILLGVLVMKIVPRDYQEACDEHLWQAIHARPDKNPLVVMATGSGKSLNIGMIIWRLMASYPHLRIMNAVHSKKLVQGNYDTLKKLWPAAPAGIYSAGLNERNLRAQITFAGIQSVAKRPRSFGHIDFLIVDEAHLISDKESTGYSKFIKALRDKNPNMVVIGYTATDYRMGTGLLTDGEMFDEVVFNLGHGESFVWMVQNGYLSNLVTKYPGFQLDSDDIGIQAGDFKNAETSQAMRDQDILQRAVDTMVHFGEEQGRKAWLTFNQSIEDAELVADMLTYKGYPHAAIHSKSATADDDWEKFKRGEYRGVCNQGMLTTGVDHPPIDLISMLRLTRSPSLWVQMIGRGTRPVYEPGFDTGTLQGRLDAILASPKPNCLVLDFCGNIERLGPINYPMIPQRRGSKGGGTPPTRLCPNCETYCHISVKICGECGYEFPPPERLRPDASDGKIIETQTIDLTKQPDTKEFAIFDVHRMIAAHNDGKNGKVDTMRVDYFSGHRKFSTWVCFEHPDKTFPRRKAQEWWLAHGGGRNAPVLTADGVEQFTTLNKPKFIKVWVNTKYPEIVDYDFRGTRFELPPEVGGPPLQEPSPDPLALEQENIKEQAAQAAYYRSTSYDDDIPF